MGWIKRNPFFAIGGIIALGLLGAAGFYFYSSWRRNAQAFQNLNEIYSTLQQVSSQKPLPGNDDSNIKLANEQTAKLHHWIQQARKHFAPIPPIPEPVNGIISGKAFADALPRTVAQLQQDAEKNSVSLPPGYNFSFQAQSGAVRFAPGSLGPLSHQLGEVKAISDVLFSAGINALESIQRVRVSEDDLQGQQSDYLDAQPVTNNLAIITPYQVTFRSFTPEIAAVLEKFAASPHGFIVRTVAVQPATASGFGEAGLGATGYGTSGYTPGYNYSTPGYAAPGYGGHGYGGHGYGRAGGEMEMPPAATPAPGMVRPAPVGRGGSQMILNEQLLRVALEVDVVKLSPRN